MRKKRIITVAAIIAVSAISLFGLSKINLPESDYTYTVPSENYASEGRHYEYYTKAECKIVAVSNDKEEVFIDHNGQIYSFLVDGTTDCKVGDTWTVTFNEAMEIVNVE